MIFKHWGNHNTYLSLHFSSIQRWWWWLICKVVIDSCDPMDCSLAGSSFHGIFQARILEWVAISFYTLKRLKTRPRGASFWKDVFPT